MPFSLLVYGSESDAGVVTTCDEPLSTPTYTSLYTDYFSDGDFLMFTVYDLSINNIVLTCVAISSLVLCPSSYT